MPGAEGRPATAVLDASVVVRWLVPERGSDEAASLLAEPTDWLAPRLMVIEVAAALRRKVTEGDLKVEFAAQALEAIVGAAADGTIRLCDDEDSASAALMLSLTLRHKVPDCLYLALAEREGAGLATADLRLAELARSRGIATLLVPA